ncbi:MAG: flagellar biosynthesis anti-sigma factor FlgM [Gammaproteobacteria bacterium]|nr:flagellar biosynthesis anti-sigma factor FlgM [Gammaproteobacteria bacterium]
MPIDISTINNNTTQTKRAGEHKHVNIVRSNSTDHSNSGPGTSLSQDSVSLTDTAMRLRALEEQIARLPIIDTQKVEQIKNSINDGKFEFNSERVAEKIINFERDLL